MDSFLEKRSRQYFEEVLEYKTVPSVLCNSYAVCLNYQEVDVWGQNRIVYLTSILQWRGFGVLSFFLPMKEKINLYFV